MKTFTFDPPDEFADILDRAIAAGRFDDVNSFVLNAVARFDTEDG